jgi:molybdopterin-guanine dinucleotide biosynthesis protein A
LANVRTRHVQFVELRDMPGANNFFFNVNTQEDLKKAQAILLQP